MNEIEVKVEIFSLNYDLIKTFNQIIIQTVANNYITKSKNCWVMWLSMYQKIIRGLKMEPKP